LIELSYLSWFSAIFREATGARKLSTKNHEPWDEWNLLEGYECGLTGVSPAQLLLASDSGIGPWEISILEAIWYGFGKVRTKEALAKRAFGTQLSRNPIKGWAAIEKCFDEGWIQFLTQDFLDRMRRELIDAGYLILGGSIDQDPLTVNPIGIISFAERGAKFYLHFLDDFKSHHVDSYVTFSSHATWSDDSDGFLTAYGTSIEECRLLIDYFIVDQEAPAEEIGRWCSNWWLRFEHGYRIRFKGRQES
jgi:hypothetical protein